VSAETATVAEVLSSRWKINGLTTKNRLSPRTNWRTDEYRGSAENRSRILVDTVLAIRSEVGPDYPVGLRMSTNDHLADGQGPEGFAEVAAVVEKEGLGYIALSDANYESMDDNVTSRSGAILDHGEPQTFRAAMPAVPLLLSSNYDPQQCAGATNAGFADGIMLARQLLADPEFPNKVLQGRQEEIVWCDHDNSCLRRLIFSFPSGATRTGHGTRNRPRRGQGIDFSKASESGP
jgi:2,4-dienoyl-CoA reductase-like NADH-dependent reductase (Old Yellow Enzyme family)